MRRYDRAKNDWNNWVNMKDHAAENRARTFRKCTMDAYRLMKFRPPLEGVRSELEQLRVDFNEYRQCREAYARAVQDLRVYMAKPKNHAPLPG